MKQCIKCKELKDFDAFSPIKGTKDSYYSRCKKCQCESVMSSHKRHPQTALAWRKKNPDRVREIKRKSRIANIQKARETNRRWAKNNPEKCYETGKRWRKKNPEKDRASGRKAMAKANKTPRGKLNRSMRTALWFSLKGNKKGRHWESLVDYSVEDLKKHLEKRFREGMSWENYGEWHIDHKIPKSKFNYEKPEDEDFKRAWALKNLQPLWAIENKKKFNKLEKPFQPSLVFASFQNGGY